MLYYNTMLRRHLLAATAAVVASRASAQAMRSRVVATFSILGNLVSEVAGDRVDLAVLVGPDTDAHTYQPRPSDARLIAAAQAVLDVVHEDHLQDNARVVGAAMHTMLLDLATRHASIGDVRGAGLFRAVEFVVPGTDREPDEALTLRIVNGLRRRHVLIGTAGIDNNILKVRPPLVFSHHHAEQFVTELDAVLTELDV